MEAAHSARAALERADFVNGLVFNGGLFRNCVHVVVLKVAFGPLIDRVVYPSVNACCKSLGYFEA